MQPGACPQCDLYCYIPRGLLFDGAGVRCAEHWVELEAVERRNPRRAKK
jgi:hypothetical protein